MHPRWVLAHSVREFFHTFHHGCERAALLESPARHREVRLAGALPGAIEDRQQPVPIVRPALEVRHDERGDPPLPQVVAAALDPRAVQVEDIVPELVQGAEDAERDREFGSPFVAAEGERPLHGQGEKRPGLAVHGAQVGIPAQQPSRPEVQLQRLPARGVGGGLGEQAGQGPAEVTPHGDLSDGECRQREQEVSRRDRLRHALGRPEGGEPATHGGRILHIIMDQAGVVEEFDGGGPRLDLPDRNAKGPACLQREEGPDPLATGVEVRRARAHARIERVLTDERSHGPNDLSHGLCVHHPYGSSVADKVQTSCQIPVDVKHPSTSGSRRATRGRPLPGAVTPTAKGAQLKTSFQSRWVITLAGLLPSTFAYAHYPHDTAYWVAVSPDPAEPRLATSLERIDLDVLGRSENGLDWAARLVQATDDGEVHSGAFLTPMRLVLATNERGLQVSEDAGDTLVRAPTVTDSVITRVVASPAVMEDGLAFATGETAVWRTQDSGVGWEAVWQATGDGFIDVDLSPDFGADGRVCAAEGEALSCSPDRGVTWTRTSIPAGTFRISVGAGHRVWAAARGEGLYESSDDGASWVLAGFAGEDVTAIAELSGGLVLLASAMQAEWRSDDAGATWGLVDVAQITVNQQRDGVNFFDFVEGPEGAVYLTSWNGLARSDDRGLTYALYATERIENTHSVVLTEGSGGGMSAWIGTYGGGPILTDIHSLEAVAFPGLPRRFTRNSPTTTSWERDGTAIFDEGYTTWRTTDHGATFDLIAEDPMANGEMQLENDVKGVALAPNPSEDPFLLTIVGQRAMSFVVSDDLGDTWTTGTQDPACAMDGFAVALSPRWPDESRAWAACGGAIYESLDRGESWSVLGDTGASFVFRIAEQVDGALLVATSDGLWRIDSGTTTQIGFPGVLVDAVAAATEEGDDTVFALVPTEGWMRSEDGGNTWAELPAPTGDVPRMVAMSPSFAEDGSVAVAGYGGAWASTDRGDSWFSIYALELYESDEDAWRSTGTWTSTQLETASGRSVALTDQVGATRTLDFRGIGIAVEAPADAEAGVMAISLDDGPPEEVTLPTGNRRVWEVHGLADGWHTLRIEALLGTVTLDDVRVNRLEVTDTNTDTGADTGPDSGPGAGDHLDHQDLAGGCSCRGSGGDALLLLPLLLLRRRRHVRVDAA